MSVLETAPHAEKLKRVVIEPLTRVEGHGKVTLLLDENNHIQQARLHIVEFRGFEKFIQGRPYWEIPLLVQRLCGICPVSHHLAAAKAVDMIAGVQQLPVTAEKLRRLLHFGQVLQSHALHFFYLASPDLLFGFDDAVAHRNIVGVLADRPELGLRGIQLRRFGQEIIRMIMGKRVHGTAAIAGGMNKALAVAERDALRAEIDHIVLWTQAAVQLIKQVYASNIHYHQAFATIRSNMMSLVRADGALELYDGKLRARDADGQMIFEQLPCRDYQNYIHEEVRAWSYMKFPFIVSRGMQQGWYRVGPLARVNNCDYIDTPLAEMERQQFKANGIQHSTLAYHWARMIEALHAAEGIRELLHDEDIIGSDLQARGTRSSEGIGVIEAPRGTLIHHYQIDDDDLISKANLIVSTTHNNQAMNESIRQVAEHYLEGQELTEPLLNHIEVAVRAYDPCLSCATHALGKMPLHLELRSATGQKLDELYKTGRGDISRTA